MRARKLALFIPLIGLSVYGASLAQTDSSSDTYQSQGQKRSECREVAFTRKPGWTLSGGFTPDGSQLLLVDALYQTILRYSDQGASLGPIDEPVKSTLENLLPVTGKIRGNELILEVSDGLMLLDKNLHPVLTKSVLSKAGGIGWSVGGLWQWEPVGRTDVVAFVDIVRGDRKKIANWKTAFVRFPLNNPNKLEVLQSFELTGTPNKGYFRSGYSYIASLDDSAYFLSMNEGLTLYKSDKGKAIEDISDVLPASLSSPALPDWDSMQEYVDMMKRIEGESLPIGLYGWNNSLYLFYRFQSAQGKTRWVLYSIDPSRKNPPRRAEIKIQANHVTVIPGPQNWAFVEKGPVLGFGAQDIPRVLLLPSKLLEAPLRATRNLICG
jgi:hypothetical protein